MSPPEQTGMRIASRADGTVELGCRVGCSSSQQCCSSRRLHGGLPQLLAPEDYYGCSLAGADVCRHSGDGLEVLDTVLRK